MDNGYREIKEDEGEVCEASDEISRRGSNDWEKTDGAVGLGTSYDDWFDFDNWIARRPIAQDEPQAYATPTDKFVAHALDATANAPDVNDTDVDMPESQWLPDVGEECAVTPHNSIWGFNLVEKDFGVVVAYSGEMFWWKNNTGFNTLSRIDKVDFEPIKTPEQLAAE